MLQHCKLARTSSTQSHSDLFVTPSPLYFMSGIRQLSVRVTIGPRQPRRGVRPLTIALPLLLEFAERVLREGFGVVRVAATRCWGVQLKYILHSHIQSAPNQASLLVYTPNCKL
jgi:hypothetical protein